MRFGTGETNITNLALPPHERAALPELTTENFQEIVRQIESSDEETENIARLCMYAKILFPDRFEFDALRNADEIWNDILNYTEKLKSNCGDQINQFVNWDWYIHFISFIKIIDPNYAHRTTTTREADLLVPSFEDWVKIHHKVAAYKKEKNWILVLSTIAAMRIVDPVQMMAGYMTEDNWDAGMSVVEAMRTELHQTTRRVFLKTIVGVLRDLRILFPERADRVQLTPHDQKTLTQMLPGIRQDSPGAYYSYLADIALIQAKHVDVTREGLHIEKSAITSAAEEKTVPPARRNF